jgi:iron complex outermembrane receptor protein
LTSKGVTVVDDQVSEVEVKHDYSDTLPSLNIAYNLTDTLVLRAAAAEVMARPDLTDLNPGGSVAIFGDPKVSYGNPFIEPFRAKAYDLGLEWYYTDNALLGVTFFQKDVESFPTSETTFLPWPETGLPDSLLGSQVDQLRNETFEVSRRINGGGAEISGTELAWQQQLTFLPGPDWMQGFGIQANYTYVDAETDSGNKMQNVSDTSYNFTLYWEGDRFQARITNSFRGEYYTNLDDDPVWKTRLVDDNSNWGVSASYDINDQLKLTFKGINITDEPKYEYEDPEVKRVVIDAYTGASYFVGVNYSF